MALTQTDLFSSCASVSGSLWYDGFAEYLARHARRLEGRRVYLSLGDQEARTRNPRLSCIQERTAAAAELLRASGARVQFDLNPGNHFQAPMCRCARAIAWLMAD